MNSELSIAVLAGLGGMLGWGLADFFAKKTIDRIGDISSLMWGHIFGTFSLFVVLLYQILFSSKQIVFPEHVNYWILLLLFGTVQAVVYLYLFKGFGKGQVGILSPVFASFTGLTALMSILIFHEQISGYLLIGLGVIFSGVLLINIDVGTLKTKRINFTHVPGLKETLVATFLAALWTLFWDRFLGGNDWLFYTTIMYTFMTIVIVGIAKFKKVSLKVAETHLLKFLFLMGLCEIVAYLAIGIGYSRTTYTSIVAILSGAFSLPTILLARFFLKEKIALSQTIGSLIILSGIILISML